MAHRTARLNPFGRQLLIDRVLDQGWLGRLRRARLFLTFLLDRVDVRRATPGPLSIGIDLHPEWVAGHPIPVGRATN